MIKYLRYILQNYFTKIKSQIPPPHFNINGKNKVYNKRVLISYISSKRYPFDINIDSHNAFIHCDTLIKYFLSKNYQVDLIDFRDIYFRVNYKYDILFIHGGVNYEKVKTLIDYNTKVIYFSTGSYWKFHNKQEVERFNNFERRNNIKLCYDRYINNNEDLPLTSAHIILAIGNEQTKSTYSNKGFSKIEIINSIINNIDIDKRSIKNINHYNCNFVYFAGSGNIHKGLDLLIEAFSKMNDKHLWIITELNDDFQDYYKNLLITSNNIHFKGWLKLDSIEFIQIIQKCNFVILPSCSEGQAVSVLECMKYGLIPIVSKYSGIDTFDFGEIIDTVTIENIIAVVNKVFAISDSDLIEKSNRSKEYVKRNHNVEKFNYSLDTILIKHNII